MARIDMQQLRYDIYIIVGQIPRGRVLTYGDIARLAGCPNLSRQVGHMLSTVPSYLHLPCHRVVNAAGRLAPHWPEQQRLLEAEGVTVETGKDGTPRIRVKDYRWMISVNNFM